MYEVYVESHFSAAHRLLHYNGKCENLHGHNWRVRLFAKGRELDASGMLIDFKELNRVLNKTLERFDHVYLNDLEDFKTADPSAERIAEIIFSAASKEISELNLVGRAVAVSRVMVWESEGSCASYCED